MHGCTEPSSTLHPYAFAMAPHNITDPIGVNANAKITKSTTKYQIHGNLLCDLLSTIALSELLTLLDDSVLFGRVPKRGEVGWWRFMRSLKIRPMVI